MANSFRAAAAALLADHGHLLPDLSGITVLVPHHHVRAPFIAELRFLIGGAGAFLPPRFATLPALAASQAAEVADEPGSLRLASLHGFLSRLGWLDEAALWPQAQAMQQLLLEMDDAMLVPPDDYADFARQVEHAARRKLAQPLDQEVRMVFEVWRAFRRSASGGRAGYAMRLARWREKASGPLYSMGLHGLSRLEQQFLERCRSARGLKTLPVSAPFDDRSRLLRAAWDEGGAVLAERATGLKEALPVSPVAGALTVHEAADMETEAQAVAAWIKERLGEGRRSIAVIALDRLAARRLRAVMERDAILMQDETGWTFSTASVSQVLDRWLTLLQDDFYHRDLLDFLKSPFVFSDLPASERLDAVAVLERRIAQRNTMNGLPQFKALAEGEAAAAGPLLQRMETAAGRFRGGGRRTLAGWLESLIAALDDLCARPAIMADQAGRQLLDLLYRLERELAADDGLYGLSQWRRWLNLQLDNATFQETEIESPIRLTHLTAARLREFDALVMLGADAAHLPSAPEMRVFNDAVRQQLGLPGERQRRADAQQELIDVLGRSAMALVSWQAWRGRDPNPASPWLLLLEAMHKLAYGTGLSRLPVRAGGTVSVRPGFMAASFPSLTGWPGRLSASAWQKLVSCPYRYFAHYGLGLGEAEEVAEEMEKADYGELVHAILKRFHGMHPVMSGIPRERLLADMEAVSRNAFRVREDAYFLARGWRLRWERRIPAYVDWALEREAAGWRWQSAETEYSRELDLPSGREVALHGRLDRLDAGADGQAVIDYKAQSAQRLRAKLKVPGEDVQLSFYGLLTGASEAGLVALDDDPVRLVKLEQPLGEAAALEAGRMRQVLTAMSEGASLPANGAPEVCAWCEMRGLCRKEHDFGA